MSPYLSPGEKKTTLEVPVTTNQQFSVNFKNAHPS